MNQDLEQLVTLQAIALEITSLRAELTRLPGIVAAAEKELAKAEAALKTVQTTLLAEEALRKKSGADAEQNRAKLGRLKKQMDSATSTQQATALEHEMGFAGDAIARLEDEELASMERSEVAEAELARATETLAKAQEALLVKRQIAAQGKEDADEALVVRGAEQVAVRAGISEDVLAMFDRLAKSRGTGLAEGVNEQCSACRMKVRPQRWNELTGREHANEIMTCESCGRILFWDLRNDRPGAWPAGDRLRRALTLDVKA
ncbi:MAG: C4-type zinc ribbon domain-containing protein [Acidobacteriaceae bacterium]|nr:C4-type zinc ribbon domain-containing protein [Acidobacteriaceae bacterium]